MTANPEYKSNGYAGHSMSHVNIILNFVTQPRSQHCLSAQAVTFSTLTGCHLNDKSVRKVLKTRPRYEISNGLQLQWTKETVLQFTRKQVLDKEMFNLH